MAYETRKKSTKVLQKIGKSNLKKYDKKKVTKKKVTKKKVTKKMTMKEHEKHHTKKHITLMKNLMKRGMTMARAHTEAMKQVGK
jgi:hypothetical protein